MKIANLLKSSANSGKLSLTVKGLLVSLIPLVIAIADKYGVSLVETELSGIVENFFTMVSLGMVIYGASRKVVVKIMATVKKIRAKKTINE